MVIISAAICDKSGDILVARQCQNITKHQLEENIRNFPKLISADQQHTFVETEFLRYVYLPLDTMYLVLLTKKNSNIIEDQETIRLLHKIVQELCVAGVSEANILKRDFDILLCFDDVISFGFRESVSLTQVQSALEMESAEEKLHIQLMKQKQAEQQEVVKKHQQEMEKRKSTKGGAGNSNSISSSQYGSFSSSGVTVAGTGSNTFTASSLTKKIDEDDEGVYRPDESASFKKPENSKATALAPKKGLVLGKKGKQVAGNQKVNPASTTQQEAAAKEIQKEIKQEQKPEVKINPLKAPVEIEILEKMSCQMTKDGSLNSFDVNGEVFLQFCDPQKAKVVIQFKHENLKLSSIKPHINLNKQLWTDKQQIVLKNVDTAFPLNTRIPSIKYKYSSTNSIDLPFTLTCWLTDGALALEVEFNAEQKRITKLQNIDIAFSFPGGESPNVISSENAEYQVEGTTFKYTIPKLDSSDSTSNIQVNFSSSLVEDDIYPLDINFALPYTFFKIEPLTVQNLSDNMQQLKFDVSNKCAADKFQVN